MSEAAAEKKINDPLIVGRYALFDELASGGMATVHLGRLLVAGGPGRTVAVKRLHAQYTKDHEFCTMFMDEARLVTRIKHPNCVRTVDVVQDDRGLFLVMEYVHGESLSRLMRISRERREPIPPKLLATLMHGVLLGLHAAHEVVGEDGKLLGVVHRDVSPQNVIVGIDGMAKVLDFGIAKAAGRMQQTREGQIKGKLAYMAPEQIRGQVDRRTDVFAAAVVLWEALAGRRLHEGLKDVEIVTRVVQGKFVPPSTYASGITADLDQIVLKGLAPDPKKRYLTAKDMATDLEKKVGLVDRAEIGRWVEKLAKPILDKRAAKAKAVEEASKELRPSESAIKAPRISTPDFFSPISTVEAAAAKSEKEVTDELDAVAATVPPVESQRDPSKGPAVRGSENKLRVATPVLPMTPVKPAKPPPPVTSTDIGTTGTGPHPRHVDPPLASMNDTGSHTASSQVTPSGTSLPFVVLPEAVPAAQRRHPAVVPLFVVSLVLALAGAGLGGYALAKRGDAAPPTPTPTITTPTVTAPTATEAAATATVTAPKVNVPAVPSVRVAPAPPPTASIAEPVAPETSAEASAMPSASAAAAPPVVTAKPKPTATAKPCDPPYTIDADGNKQYKPECMGL